MEELWVLAKRGFDTRVFRRLDLDFPLVVHYPARDEVVIISIQRSHQAEEGVFVGEPGEERLVLEDLGAVGRGATGYAEDASINGVGGRYFEVVTL